MASNLMRSTCSLAAVLVLALCACQAPRLSPELGTSPPRTGDEIVIAGQRFHVGAPVVLWTEWPGYDAYRRQPCFAPATEDPKKTGLRYEPGRFARTPLPNHEFLEAGPVGEPDSRTEIQKARTLPDPAPRQLVAPASRDPLEVARVVDQFVLHFDVCGVSKRCFQVLHDERNLSVHFLLDVDGTIYQTLDLADTAWHATKANVRSVGIEIANIGAYPPGKRSALDTWYARDAAGPYLQVPAWISETGVRTPGFVARPMRAERILGTIQGDALEMHDFTREQYDSLVKLAAVLCRELPRIQPDAPRDATGQVTTSALSDEEWRAFRGILGHFHVQTNKNDPGPAFDWEPFLERVRERMTALSGGD